MNPSENVTESPHGVLPDGRTARLFTLENANGLRVQVSEYGALLVSAIVPDREGNFAEVTAGFDSFDGWLLNPHYFGATVGRFANRIAGGKFPLDGKSYKLATNNAPGGIPCHLHGGIRGFDKKLWRGHVTANGGVELACVSPDGEEGYPGTVSAKVHYRLTDEDELIWEATAVTDAPTVINLVLHTYWNLSGGEFLAIGDHLLTISAEQCLELDEGSIPTGKLLPVAGTALDFTSPRLIGERIEELETGYDHCLVLENPCESEIAAVLEHPVSGRVLKISTNQPGIQIYSAHFFDGELAGRGGCRYPSRSAIALETQNFPDAPNQPSFPSAVIRPGEIYQHRMIHRFETR